MHWWFIIWIESKVNTLYKKNTMRVYQWLVPYFQQHRKNVIFFQFETTKIMTCRKLPHSFILLMRYFVHMLNMSTLNKSHGPIYITKLDVDTQIRWYTIEYTARKDCGFIVIIDFYQKIFLSLKILKVFF